MVAGGEPYGRLSDTALAVKGDRIAWIGPAAAGRARAASEQVPVEEAGDLWMLPGLWELIFSLGVFASCRFLPRQMFAVGVWYLACGLTCLMAASGSKALSPWEMGIPFGVGQLLVAVVLQYCFEETGEE